jgi:ribonuclease HI
MTHVVSTTLVVERGEEGHACPVQHPVYFINEVLGPSKKKYPQVQKLLYAVLLTARKLHHYFDDHKVIVVTGFPIGDILHNKEAIGRIAKWACELGSHDIEFRPRTAIKTQALVDFVSEWTEQQVLDNPETAEVWRMYFDGSLKLQGAGAGILFIAPGGEQLKYVLQLLFPASNNVAEYEALIHGLNIAISLGIKRLIVYGDSLVVISQINKEWDCSNDSMGKYCTAVRKLEDKFEGLEFHHVERDRNTAVDTLSKLGSSQTQVPPGVFVQEILHPSIHNSSYSHFRRPEAAENKPVAAENKLFSAATGLFSAASGRQKKLAENKALFLAARAWPPKIAYFQRLAPWPPKITDYFRRPDSQPPEIKNAENKIPIFGGQRGRRKLLISEQKI